MPIVKRRTACSRQAFVVPVLGALYVSSFTYATLSIRTTRVWGNCLPQRVIKIVIHVMVRNRLIVITCIPPPHHYLSMYIPEHSGVWYMYMYEHVLKQCICTYIPEMTYIQCTYLH